MINLDLLDMTSNDVGTAASVCNCGRPNVAVASVCNCGRPNVAVASVCNCGRPRRSEASTNNVSDLLQAFYLKSIASKNKNI